MKGLFALEIVHPLELLMHGFELTLNVIALWQRTQGCQGMLHVVLGINQQTAVEASRLVTHGTRETPFIQAQPVEIDCVNHNAFDLIKAPVALQMPRSDSMGVQGLPQHSKPQAGLLWLHAQNGGNRGHCTAPDNRRRQRQHLA